MRGFPVSPEEREQVWGEIRALLVHRRLDLRMRQHDLGVRLGGMQGSVSHWETGKTHPTAASLVGWLDALGVDLLALVTGVVDPPAKTVGSEEDEMADRVLGLMLERFERTG
jgi:transcriptional regulator with XRE-family HTH domain